MELLDRYLQAVKRHLPWERQDDIIAELRANLEAQLEDKEAELGRPLTKEEAEQWLKQMGAPIQVAALLSAPAVFDRAGAVSDVLVCAAAGIVRGNGGLCGREEWWTLRRRGRAGRRYAGDRRNLPWMWLTLMQRSSR